MITLETIAAWMTEHGRPEYAHQIHALQCTREEMRAEGGRYGHLCPFVQADIARINAQIEEIQQRALDRYTDWVTD